MKLAQMPPSGPLAERLRAIADAEGYAQEKRAA
jgi:hypothetical protein